MTPDQANATQWYRNYKHKEEDGRFYTSMPVAVFFQPLPLPTPPATNVQPLFIGNTGNRAQPLVSSVH